MRRSKNNKHHQNQPKTPKKIRKQPKISEHFSRRDFACKSELGTQSLKLSLGLVGGLEELRSIVGKKIFIKKGYECPEAAEKHGKVKRNHHVSGIAADIVAEDTDIKTLFKAAEQVVEFKGIGLNLEDDYVHVDVRKVPERSLWVEEDGSEVPLTDDLRKKLL